MQGSPGTARNMTRLKAWQGYNKAGGVARDREEWQSALACCDAVPIHNHEAVKPFTHAQKRVKQRELGARVVPLDRPGEQSFSSTDSCVAGTTTQDARTRHAEKGWPSRIVTDWQEQSVRMLGVRNGFHDSGNGKEMNSLSRTTQLMGHMCPSSGPRPFAFRHCSSRSATILRSKIECRAEMTI